MILAFLISTYFIIWIFLRWILILLIQVSWMTSMTSTKFAAFSRKFCLANWFRDLTKASLSIFRKCSNAFLTASILRIEFFLTWTTPLFTLFFLSFALTLLFFSYYLIFCCASSTCTCLTTLITYSFFSFRSRNNTNTWFIWTLKMNAWITTVFVV